MKTAAQTRVCEVPKTTDSRRRILVIGDSHAEYLYAWFVAHSQVPVDFFTQAECPPVPHFERLAERLPLRGLRRGSLEAGRLRRLRHPGARVALGRRAGWTVRPTATPRTAPTAACRWRVNASRHWCARNWPRRSGPCSHEARRWSCSSPRRRPACAFPNASCASSSGMGKRASPSTNARWWRRRHGSRRCSIP